MSIRPATEDDLPAITVIFNHAIENSLVADRNSLLQTILPVDISPAGLHSLELF